MARKLFPSYGSALANNLLTALERERVVGRFVTVYVCEHDRQAILGGPSRDRELADTIGREAVLAIVHEVRQNLPKFFGKKRHAALLDEEKEALNAFSRELISALGRAWHWEGEDRRQFGRDLRLYSEWATRQAQARKQRRSSVEEPPFVARVALLLDPSMLEQAHRAARKFHDDIGYLAQKLLRQTLRSRRI